MSRTRRRIVAVTLVLGCLAAGPQLRWEAVAGATAVVGVTVDVAMDATTWRQPRGDLLTGDVLRGDTFIVNGRIYPAGTLPATGFDGQVGPGPNLAGSIGEWVCRGTFNFDGSEIFDPLNPRAPHVTSTQFFYFDDGRVLVTDGPEGGIVTLRAIVGGAGPWAGAAGDVTETPLGFNPTGLFNVRMAIRLNKQSVKG